MSLPNEKNKDIVKDLAIEPAFQIKREHGGYCLYQLAVQNNKVITKVKISEPDILVITVAHLEKAIRKDHGI